MDSIQIVNDFKQGFSCLGNFSLQKEVCPYGLKSSRAVIRVSFNGDLENRDRSCLRNLDWLLTVDVADHVRRLHCVFIPRKNVECRCL
jgi:hypothetical protein